MASPILGLPELSVSIASKYSWHNEANRELEAAAAGMLTHDMGSDADYTLTTTGTPQEWQYLACKITDTGVVLTTGRNIVVPVNTKPYIFINATAQTLTLKTSAGTGIAVATNKAALLYCDGTNVIRISADS